MVDICNDRDIFLALNDGRLILIFSPKVGKLGASAEEAGKNNVSFLSYFLLGDLEKCLEILITSNRIPEAAFFARCHNHISHLHPGILNFSGHICRLRYQGWWPCGGFN